MLVDPLMYLKKSHPTVELWSLASPDTQGTGEPTIAQRPLAIENHRDYAKGSTAIAFHNLNFEKNIKTCLIWDWMGSNFWNWHKHAAMKIAFDLNLECQTLEEQMGVSKNSGTPKWMVKTMESPIKMDDLGVPLFLETPKSGQLIKQ